MCTRKTTSWTSATRPQRPSLTDPNPEIAQQARTDIERLGAGWKLHLNFDAEDPIKVATVDTVLDSLQLGKRILQYKIGHGGGRASGAPGKEATVYIGSRDNAEIVARYIGQVLDPVLDPPEGDTLHDDRPFGEAGTKVMGRFDIGRYDRDFHQYGPNGLPLLNQDVDPWNKIDRDAAIARAEAALVSRYGEFYTGTPPPPTM